MDATNAVEKALGLFRLLSLIQAGTATIVLCLIFAGWLALRRRAKDAHWRIHSRSNRHVAVQASPRRITWWIAFTFAAGFLLALPVWWYRWGFRAAALCLVLTAACGVLVGVAIAAAFGLQADLLLGAMLGAPARVSASVLLGYFDGDLRSRRLRALGWIAGPAWVQAPSAKDAVHKWSQCRTERPV